jgi:hypothetical protein
VDKIKRIKRLVESSLDTSFGGDVMINDLVVLPTQKFDENMNKWVPDSHTIFLSIKNKSGSPYYESKFTINEITNFLESLLGIECCVDFS